ncbi:MAG: S24 family peptidase [Saprospiraceae bacterium]|nr:S24 family peptidase [Saprospiraceae bacterium]MCB0542793.1 S24 family peptidase [Saprospiraceae bacterium]MCB0574257.1 S24 family peptidase [Saprospiraceae bacterium]MCB9305298.1 S24 family peptidase [Lewinellaceae bacterium]MCB9356058.1 S24 family peptidase [Lewinellaceae bacterium]
MIKEDRIELNKRFMHAFKLLEERGAIVKNDRSGKGVGDVAEKVLGNKAYGHIVRAFLNPGSKRVIDYGQAQSFCRAYDINEAWLLHGIGNPFGFEAPGDAFLNDKVGLTGGGNILYTTIRAFAGSTLGDESREDNTYFSIPGVSGTGLVAFQIDGNSMDPVIRHGDIVVCKSVENLNDIRDNEIYAVRSNGSVWVKYVQKIFNNRGRITRLKLISANYFDNDPFEEEVNETTRLYKVVRKISNI